LKDVVTERLQSVTLVDIFNLKVVGFAITLSWSSLTFFSTLIHYSTRNGIVHLNSTYAFSLVGVMFVMTIAGVFSHHLHRWTQRRMIPLFSAGVLCFATVLLCLIEAGWFEQPWCSIISIITGIALGALFLGWGEIFRRMPPLNSPAAIIASFTLAALIFLLVLSLPPTAARIVTVALPLLAGLTLAQLLYNAGRPLLLEPLPLDKSRFLIKAILSVGILMLAEAFVCKLFLRVEPIVDLYRWVFIAATLAALLVLGIGLLFTQQADFGFVYRMILFITAFIFLALPLLETPSFLGDVVSLSPYCMFQMLIWVILARTASTFRLSSITLFGFGWGAATAGVLAGDFLGSLLKPYCLADSTLMGIATLACAGAILFSYFFIFDEKAIIRLTSLKKDTGTTHQPFRMRCEEVARLYSLTPKETEVMILLAKGRSNPRIQEELNISSGTANTHLTRIYKKLDVHDKQSLIDLLDGRQNDKRHRQPLR
jgi:DNA-binding CsgD family transcriptional regulator